MRKVFILALVVVGLSGCATHTPPMAIQDGPLRFASLAIPPILYVDQPNKINFRLGGTWTEPLCITLQVDEMLLLGQCGEFELRQFELKFLVPLELYALKRGAATSTWGMDTVDPIGAQEPIEGMDEFTVRVQVEVSVYLAEPDNVGNLRPVRRVVHVSRNPHLQCNSCSYD